MYFVKYSAGKESKITKAERGRTGKCLIISSV